MSELLSNPSVVGEIVRGVFILIGAIITGGAVLLAALKGGGLLRELRKRKIYRLRGELVDVCPHGELGINEEEIYVNHLFHSPVGTTWYYCRLCNLKVYREDIEQIATRLVDKIESKKEIKSWDKQLTKARRLRKKLDALGNWANI